ncbi:kinase-like domain-containing protein [Syncephalis fuscata]|nr:kinase-like domain-containing protein [Syncephalis fuscata]
MPLPVRCADMPQVCFKVSAGHTAVSCTNTGLPILMVNGVELGIRKSKVFTRDCIIEIPSSNAVFNVHIIKHIAPAQIENSTLFQRNIEARYVITGVVLGRGGFGTVRLGQNRERRAASPNVVKLLGNEVTPINTYLILQYVAGGDLSQYLRLHAPLPEMEVKTIFKQLLEGIAFIHSKNVIHRDIKPSNVLMLGGRGDPKVVYTDFGIAQSLRSSSVVHNFGGTTPYMAPEVLLGTEKRESLLDTINKDPLLKNRLTPALLGADGCGKPADIWSLGATLHKIIFGCCPYSETHLLVTYIISILESSPTFGRGQPNEPSEPIVRLMKGLLDCDSAARYTVEKALDCSWFTDAVSSPVEEASVVEERCWLAPGLPRRVLPFRKCRLNKRAF